MATTPIERLWELSAATARDRHLIALWRGKDDAMTDSGDKIAALSDAAQALERAGIGYALIGGVAVGIHSGAPRATADVDLAVVSTTDRSTLRTTLETAGFRCTGEFAHSINFRHASGEPLQLAMDPGFDVMIDRAERLVVGAHRVRLIACADLIVMKERAAADPQRRKSKRLRDQADVELLRGDVPDPDEGW
jgi:hypothetical protein